MKENYDALLLENELMKYSIRTIKQSIRNLNARIDASAEKSKENYNIHITSDNLMKVNSSNIIDPLGAQLNINKVCRMHLDLLKKLSGLQIIKNNASKITLIICNFSRNKNHKLSIQLELKNKIIQVLNVAPQIKGLNYFIRMFNENGSLTSFIANLINSIINCEF